jgi:hypothetical protein
MATKIDRYAYVDYSPDDSHYYISYRELGFWQLSEQYWYTEREAIKAYRAGMVPFESLIKNRT